MLYFSKVDQEGINRIRMCYQIPDNVVLRIPDPDERATWPSMRSIFKLVFVFLYNPFVRDLLDFLSLAPGQVVPNGWRTVISCMVMWRMNSNGREDLTLDEFLFCYEPCQIAASPGL